MLKRGGELRARVKSETQSQSLQLFGCGWKRMGLLLSFNLQTMLGPAEKPIRAIKIDNFISRNQFELGDTLERLQCAWLLQKGVPRSVDKLQRLHNEFNFANTTATKFNIPLQFALSYDIPLDSSFDIGDLVQQIRRRTFRVNERLMLPQEFVSELATASNSSSLDQRQAFPSFPEPTIIVLHALK